MVQDSIIYLWGGGALIALFGTWYTVYSRLPRNGVSETKMSRKEREALAEKERIEAEVQRRMAAQRRLDDQWRQPIDDEQRVERPPAPHARKPGPAKASHPPAGPVTPVSPPPGIDPEAVAAGGNHQDALSKIGSKYKVEQSAKSKGGMIGLD